MEKRDIFVVYGDKIREMTRQLMDAARITEMIGDKNKRIGLKPNLVVAAKPETGATTHPEIAAAAIEYLQEKGFHNLVILEGSWVGDRTSYAFKLCGWDRLAAKYGVELIDTQKDSYKSYDCKGLRLDICDSAMAVDFMINLPVVKGHCQTVVTCSLKNNKGIIPNREKRHFHSLGLHKPIAHLNTRVRNDFILVDAICGDLDFEEGGNPVPMHRMYAACDPVLCDSYACSLMGHDISEVPYIGLAERLGVGTSDLTKAKITELNHPSAGGTIRLSRRVENLAKKAEPKDACSACYAGLIHALARMEESGDLRRLKNKICIGQGYKGQTGKLGVGNCTCLFEHYVKGCPPKADEVLDFLMEQR